MAVQEAQGITANPKSARSLQVPSPTATAHKIGDIILDKKASDLVVVDVESVTTLSDFIIIATGSNSRQLQAIAIDVVAEMKKDGHSHIHVEGMEQGWWILIDCGDVIVHVMQEEARRYYDLERLWSDGKVIRRVAGVA